MVCTQFRWWVILGTVPSCADTAANIDDRFCADDGPLGISATAFTHGSTALQSGLVGLVWQDEPTLDLHYIFCRVSSDRGASRGQEYNLTPNSVYTATDPDVAVEREFIHTTWCYKESGLARYQIYYRRARIVRDTTEVTLAVSTPWMMVSVPVGVKEFTVSSVSPHAVTQAFFFDGRNYIAV